MSKLTYLAIAVSVLFVSCQKEVKTTQPIEIIPTGKFILFYDKLKNLGHFDSKAGFVFEIKNNKNEKIVLDSMAIKGVVDYLDDDLLSAVLIQYENSYYIFRDSLVILPKTKQKILVGVQGTGLSIEDDKKLLSVCWIDKAQFVFRTKQGSIKIEKSMKPFYEMPDDQFLYYVDDELMKNKYVETKYKNFEFWSEKLLPDEH